MDIEIIKALGDVPVVVILIYLLVRQQGQIEKLLTAMIESEREHARNLCDIASGRSGVRSAGDKVASNN